MKIVIDTNVILSGLQSDMGYSYRLLSILPDSRFQVCISVPLVLEYEAQLKKHLSKKIFADEDIDDFINYFCAIAERVKIYYLWRPHLADPFDDHILELAITSNCKYIVTYNLKDFKQIAEYGITAITPQQFLSILAERR